MKRPVLCLLLPTFQAGGMERVMAELAGYFCARHSDEVHLVLYGKNIRFYYPLPERLVVHQPDFIFSDRFRWWSMLKRLVFLRRTIQGLQPQKILSFGEYWNSFVLLALLGLPYPVYVSDRCQPGKRMSLMHFLLRRMLYPGAKGMIAQTRTARDIYFKELRHRNIRVIANPVRLPESINGVPKEQWVVSVGRLIPSKNHDRLIDLFAGLGQSGWRLVIVGGDAQKMQLSSRLRAQIEGLNASGSIELAGDQTDVASYYRRAKIFAFTSESEGFPNVLAEALSFGLPAVAFDCVAGPADLLIDGENGFLVPLGNYTLFAQRLQQLMSDEELRRRMGQKARAGIVRYSLDNIGRTYYDFISGK